MTDKPVTSAVLETLRNTIRRDGVQAGLQYLNSLGDHRYTGLFLFDGDTLANTFIFDRQDSHQGIFPIMPANYSYCLTVKQTGKPLKITNAPMDVRVEGHPSRQTVQSYCGAPLRDTHGAVFGTVCNFSLEPCGAEDDQIALLEKCAAVLLECERHEEIGWRRSRVY